MKKTILFSALIMTALAASSQSPQLSSTPSKSLDDPDRSGSMTNSLYIDVHDLPPGKVSYADALAAHKKDLETEKKYGVNFIRFWIDEKKGKVYCLSLAKDTQSILKTHSEAHGLIPSTFYKMSEGSEAKAFAGKQYFLDIHRLGAGHVTAEAVAEAHKKDLAVEGKYGVNFINYWLDEKSGTIFCLSQASAAKDVIHTHKEAHGLLPATIEKVKQGE